MESLVGQQLLNAARRVNRAPIDGRLSSFQVGWRILREFFPGRAGTVSGVGYDEKLRGLHVKGTTITVGKAFVEDTNPSTLEQRRKEMGEALDLVARGSSGFIAMK
jgi:hypothetical protein